MGTMPLKLRHGSCNIKTIRRQMLLALLCIALLLGSGALAATTMLFSGLSSVWCHGMVVDGQYAYISGLTSQSVGG